MRALDDTWTVKSASAGNEDMITGRRNEEERDWRRRGVGSCNTEGLKSRAIEDTIRRRLTSE